MVHEAPSVGGLSRRRSGSRSKAVDHWVKREGDLSDGYYELAGWFQGTIELNGNVIDINCGALRDRGWGPRHADVADPLRAGWPHVFASPEGGWHLYDPQTELSFEDDAVEGTTETVTTGFYIRDGIKGSCRQWHARG